MKVKIASFVFFFSLLFMSCTTEKKKYSFGSSTSTSFSSSTSKTNSLENIARNVNERNKEKATNNTIVTSATINTTLERPSLPENERFHYDPNAVPLTPQTIISSSTDMDVEISSSPSTSSRSNSKREYMDMKKYDCPDYTGIEGEVYCNICNSFGYRHRHEKVLIK